MKRLVFFLVIAIAAVGCGDPNPKITYTVTVVEGSPDKATVTYNEHLQTNQVEVLLPWTNSFKADATESLYIAGLASNSTTRDESLTVRVTISVGGDETQDAEAQGIDLVSATASDSL